MALSEYGVDTVAGRVDDQQDVVARRQAQVAELGPCPRLSGDALAMVVPSGSWRYTWDVLDVRVPASRRSQALSGGELGRGPAIRVLRVEQVAAEGEAAR